MLISVCIHVILISLTVILLVNRYNSRKITYPFRQFTLRTPFDDEERREYHIYNNTLIDLEDFEFIIKPNICSQPFLLLITVPSDINSFKYRDFIRSKLSVISDAIKIVFIIGVTEDEESTAIYMEHLLYQDIVQGNIYESYHNLTYKHMFGLKWVSRYCTTARYVLKIDEDVFLHYRQMISFLVRQLSPWGAKGLIAGFIKYAEPVQRNEGDHFYVPVDDYLPNYYPPYCWGPFILYSQDVVPYLVELSQGNQYLIVDDVFITGLLANEAGILRTDISQLYLHEDNITKLLKRGTGEEYPFIFGPAHLRLKDLKRIWKSMYSTN